MDLVVRQFRQLLQRRHKTGLIKGFAVLEDAENFSGNYRADQSFSVFNGIAFAHEALESLFSFR